jgi:hypothetical protein
MELRPIPRATRSFVLVDVSPVATSFYEFLNLVLAVGRWSSECVSADPPAPQPSTGRHVPAWAQGYWNTLMRQQHRFADEEWRHSRHGGSMRPVRQYASVMVISQTIGGVDPRLLLAAILVCE